MDTETLLRYYCNFSGIRINGRDVGVGGVGGNFSFVF